MSELRYGFLPDVAEVMRLAEAMQQRYMERTIPTGDLYKGITMDAWIAARAALEAKVTAMVGAYNTSVNEQLRLNSLTIALAEAQREILELKEIRKSFAERNVALFERQIKSDAALAAAQKWEQAMIDQCMAVESCLVANDPYKTLNNLIDWHVQNASAEAQKDTGGGL